MKKLKTLSLAALAAVMLPNLGLASEGQKDAKHISFSFEGAFGKFDRNQLQRGYRVYKEVCSACHSMNFISFRNLSEAGIFTEEQVKALAATFTVPGDPGEDGSPTERPGLPSDRFPAPFANEKVAASAFGGAVPPDLSLITKSRPGWYGTFNQFWNGIGGPQYVYSVLTGYEDPSEEIKKETPEGKYYNPYFGSGHFIGMVPPLEDGTVTFDDGAPNTKDDLARDVSAFLAWTAEPHMEARKSTGFMVMIYLAVLAGLLYLVKQRVWKDAH